MQLDIKGKDVIAHPGHQLNTQELTVLVGLADGQTAGDIATAAGIHRDQIRFVETRINQKLNAKNKTHAISRAFLLGVLAPRLLCLFLCVLSCIQSGGDDFMRLRRPNRTNHRPQTTRLVKSQRAGGRNYA
jgi:DNA-binding CsgD family transcriptional regulator